MGVEKPRLGVRRAERGEREERREVEEREGGWERGGREGGKEGGRERGQESETRCESVRVVKELKVSVPPCARVCTSICVCASVGFHELRACLRAYVRVRVFACASCESKELARRLRRERSNPAVYSGLSVERTSNELTQV